MWREREPFWLSCLLADYDIISRTAHSSIALAQYFSRDGSSRADGRSDPFPPLIAGISGHRPLELSGRVAPTSPSLLTAMGMYKGGRDPVKDLGPSSFSSHHHRQLVIAPSTV